MNETTSIIFEKKIEQIMAAVFKLIGSIPKSKHEPISRFLGRAWFHFDKRHRVITLDNLKGAYKDHMSSHSQRLLAKAIFVNLSRFIFESCWAMNRSHGELKALINTDEAVYIKKSLEKGKGVLILTGHLGNWEFLPMAPSFEGIKAHAVYRPLDFPPMENFIQKTRSRFGTGLIPVRGAVAKIDAALKRNEAIGLLMDQNASFKNGVVVDFFDRKAVANKGLAILALKTGAPVHPAFLVRDGQKYKMVSGPEIPLIKTGDHQKDLEINTQQYNRVIESFVRQYPDQWFWVHRKWKTRVSSPWPRKSN